MVHIGCRSTGYPRSYNPAYRLSSRTDRNLRCPLTKWGGFDPIWAPPSPKWSILRHLSPILGVIYMPVRGFGVIKVDIRDLGIPDWTKCIHVITSRIYSACGCPYVHIMGPLLDPLSRISMSNVSVHTACCKLLHHRNINTLIR